MWLLASHQQPSNTELTVNELFLSIFILFVKFSSINFYEISVKDFITICSIGINKGRIVNMSFIRPELQTQGQRNF